MTYINTYEYLDIIIIPIMYVTYLNDKSSVGIENNVGKVMFPHKLSCVRSSTDHETSEKKIIC